MTGTREILTEEDPEQALQKEINMYRKNCWSLICELARPTELLPAEDYPEKVPGFPSLTDLKEKMAGYRVSFLFNREAYFLCVADKSGSVEQYLFIKDIQESFLFLQQQIKLFNEQLEKRVQAVKLARQLASQKVAEEKQREAEQIKKLAEEKQREAEQIKKLAEEKRVLAEIAQIPLLGNKLAKLILQVQQGLEVGLKIQEAQFLQQAKQLKRRFGSAVNDYKNVAASQNAASTQALNLAMQHVKETSSDPIRNALAKEQLLQLQKNISTHAKKNQPNFRMLDTLEKQLIKMREESDLLAEIVVKEQAITKSREQATTLAIELNFTAIDWVYRGQLFEYKPTHPVAKTNTLFEANEKCAEMLANQQFLVNTLKEIKEERTSSKQSRVGQLFTPKQITKHAALGDVKDTNTILIKPKKPGEI